jgi:hypothetical protein
MSSAGKAECPTAALVSATAPERETVPARAGSGAQANRTVNGPFSPHAPSVLLPLRFMLTGLLAFVGAVGALVLRPDMLATYHYNQYIIAITHLFVLGWISTIVMGAIYQLVPVALETKLYSESLARWQFVFHLVGLVGMVWMFWTWNLKQVGHFGTILVLGVVMFVYNIVRTLLRVPRWNVVATAVGSALVWLSAGTLAGLTITAGKCSYEMGGGSSPVVLAPLVGMLKSIALFMARFDPISAMHAHAHLGAVGVFIVLIAGISFKLVPMFTLSEIQDRRRAGAAILLLNAGLLGSFFAVLLRSRLKIAFASLVVLGLAFYGVELVAILRARKRRPLDWGMRYFLTAVAMLAPVSILGLVLAWPGLPLTRFTGQLENVYGFLALVGVISLAIIGMLYKIVPFIVWYASYSRLIGAAKVPALSDLYSSRVQAVGYWTGLAGLAITAVGAGLGSAPMVRAGCGLLIASIGCLMINVARILSHLFRPRFKPLAFKPATITP